MELKLDGKVIIVTGGASGIGESICKKLAAEGAIPCIIDMDSSNASRVVHEITEAGMKAFGYLADLTDPNACNDVVLKISAELGKVDGLVNNAGLNDAVGLESGGYASFILSLKKNIVHYYEMTRLVYPFLKTTQGTIVNIVSKVFETGQGGTSGYAASNGIRSELTEQWANELGQFGIRVNGIVVAECWTPQYQKWIDRNQDGEKIIEEIKSTIPLENRFTTPEEIADTAVFLLSEKSGGVTGELFHVDGGYVHLDRKIT